MKAFNCDNYVNLKTVTGCLEDRNRNTSDQTNVYEYPVDSALDSLLPGVQRTTKIRLATVSAVCLGLLCFLLLAGIIGLVVLYIKVPNSWDEEKHLLQTLNNNLTKERDNLQRKISVLNEMVSSPQWYKLGFSWYYISNGKKTWNESRQDCLSRGADLVIIKSKEEQDYLIKQFNKKVWIGLTDIEVEGIWKWVDGTPLTTSLSFWYSGQPDNGGTPSIGEEDCAEICKIDGQVLGWNDYLCGNTNFWICEIDT